jgi:hypothetical protein
MMQKWTELENSYPQYVSHDIIGRTVRGNSLYVYRIGNPNGGKVMIDGSLHGSEDVGSQATYEFAVWLLTSNTQRAKNILAGNYFLVIPYINYDMPWRKNAHGVDLARNFPYGWGYSGSSYSTAFDYRGPSAGSEPETKAVVYALEKYKPTVYINMHCGMHQIGYSSRTTTGLALGAKIRNSYRAVISASGIADKYPTWGSSSGGSGGSLWGQAYYEATVAFLFETQTWAELPTSLNEWLANWYPGIRAVFLAALESVQTSGSTSGITNPIPPVTSSNVIFSDGFESGNFNAWSSTLATTGESMAITSVARHDGTYGARFTSNGGASRALEQSYACKVLPSRQSNLYARGYVKVSQSGIAQNDDLAYFLRFRSGSNDVAYAGWRMVNHQLRWSLIVHDGTSLVFAYSSSSPNLNVWYSIELHWKASPSGVGELWVNGQLVASVSGVNTATLGNADSVRFGLEVYKCDATTVYGDTLTISQTRIGP